MKNIEIAFLFILVFQLQSFGQVVKSDSTAGERPDSIVKSTNPTETEKMVVTLIQKMDSLAAKDEKEDIGEFKLYNFKPNVYSNTTFLSKLNEKKKDEKDYDNDLKNIRKGAISQYTKKEINLFEKVGNIDIEKVELYISEGVIENIRVKTRTTELSKFRVFENKSSIPLENLDIAAQSRFLYDVRDQDYFLKINDFMYFLPNPGQYYLPDDVSCTLNSKNTECKLDASIDLNSNLDIRVYSDFLSLFNIVGNGLIQTEAKSKIIWNSTPSLSNFYLVNFIEPSVRYSKFDSKYNAVKIEDYRDPLLISTKEALKMNQLSYLNLGFKLNLLRAKIFRTFTEINVGFTYDFVNIQLNNSTENIPANMYSYYYEARGGVAKSKYFGMTYSFGILFQNIPNTGLNFISDTEAYIIPEIIVYYYANGNSSNNLFLRFKSFSNLLYRESFPLFQFGYSSKISFKKK